MNYEELTVPELKNLAEENGIEIHAHAHKADIIEALEAASKTSHGKKKPKEGKNMQEHRMSSTGDQVHLTPEEFRKLKLIG